MSRFSIALVVVLLLLVPSAFAQLPVLGFSGSGGGTRDGGYHGNATFRVPIPALAVMPNAPYSGEQTEVITQTLADGTHVTRETGFHQKAWRDSQGRVRVERSVLAGSRPTALRNVPTLVQIQDSIAGYAYIMDDVSRVAHRIRLSVIAPRPSRPAPTQTSPGAGASPNPTASSTQPGSQVENLGAQMIDGIVAIGTRNTRVIPAGAQQNDAPFTTTREEWVSPDLHLTILVITTDPRQGVSTSKIANLTRFEPSPDLFLVPAGYTVVDESETFTIKWGDN